MESLLTNIYGPRAIYDAGSWINAKLSSVTWHQNWSTGTLLGQILLFMIQSQLPLVHIGGHYQPT
jgi:hypothetical protein